MNFGVLDWVIVGAFLLVVTLVANYCRRYVRSVADFVSANRCAGRYVLAIAQEEASMGAVSVVFIFLLTIKVGFSAGFWESAKAPLTLFIALSGWIIYRYRATRVLTLAQLFELRYGRRFRIFSGILTFIAGIINVGIFPVIAAKFLIVYCGLPMIPVEFHGWETDLMVVGLSGFLVILAVYFTFVGGQISVLATDFVQGFFTIFLMTGLGVYLYFYHFSWSTFAEALVVKSYPGNSLIDPTDIGERAVFDVTYYLIMFFFYLYNRMAWQGNSGYNTAPRTAHEAKMAPLATGLGGAKSYGFYFLVYVAMIYLFHPAHAEFAAAMQEKIQALFPGSGSEAFVDREQMIVPLTIAHILPIGLKGAFAAVILGLFISTNNSGMHSWGSIFIQDVVCPFLKKPLSPKQHVRLLRLAIIGVGLFVFLFGVLFPLKEYIMLFWQITVSIFVAGAGVCIAGGLYWKRGTAGGAWAAMIIGSVGAGGSVVLRTIWEDVYFLTQISPEFPFDSQRMSFFVAMAAVIAYVGVSLITHLLGKGTVANMDKLLHRGRYAIQEEEEELSKHAMTQPVGRFWRMIGVNNREFSLLDKGWFLWYSAQSVNTMIYFLITGSLILAGWFTVWRWMAWIKIGFFMAFLFFPITLPWLTIGSIKDFIAMFRILDKAKLDETDDGRVIEQVVESDTGGDLPNED
jgi:SSS family solute:Na+ symporter